MNGAEKKKLTGEESMNPPLPQRVTFSIGI